MPHSWVLIRALYPAALLLAAAASASASIIRPDGARLFERASTCGANFSPCSQPGLPANFCCEADATCNLLAANTTVLCCPKNANCDKISPITCDLGLQDPAANPSAEIKTTVLDGILTTCAGQCCPFGYSCDGKNCVKDADQSKKPPVKAPTSSSQTTSPTATSTHGSSTTVAVSGVSSASASAAPSTQTPTTSTSGTASTVTIVGGVIGGLVGLALLILAVVMLRHRRKKALREKQALQRQDSTSSFGNIISNPVPHANYPSQRLDFLAKTHPTGSPKSYAPSSPTAVASPRSQKTTTTQQKDGGFGETREYYGGFMPPNSPYSPYARRPDSQMSDAPRSYHASAEITGLRSLTHWPGGASSTPFSKSGSQKKKGKNGAIPNDGFAPAPAPPTVTITPATNDDGARDGARGRFGVRGRESEGESINVFADPLMVPGVGAGGMRPESSATTWSNIQQRADNAMHGEAGSSNGRGKFLGESPLRR